MANSVQDSTHLGRLRTILLDHPHVAESTGWTRGLGAWTFYIQATGLPPSLVDANNNLIPSVIEDIYIVCHYTAK